MIKKSLCLFIFVLLFSACSKADSCKTISDMAFNKYKTGDYVEADRLYRKAIDCSPEDASLWNAFGEVNYKAGRIEVADSAFEKAIEIDTEYATPWYNYAIMAFDSEDYVKSLEYIEKALALDGDNVKAKKTTSSVKREVGSGHGA